MNWYFLIAGLIAGFTIVGHFTVGSRDILKPMLEAGFDDVPKKVMHCVFHYISVYIVLSAITLLLLGFGVDLKSDTTLLVHFIAINYALFGVVQLILALTSNIPKPLFKLFQWVFFVLIAVFAWLGLM